MGLIHEPKSPKVAKMINTHAAQEKGRKLNPVERDSDD